MQHKRGGLRFRRNYVGVLIAGPGVSLSFQLLRALYLAFLEDDHPLVPRQQPAEHPSAVAVTKTLLPEVVIKKAQARTKRGLQCEFL